jgi:hypothetical protein
MKNILQSALLSCLKATLLVEKSQLEKLSPIENLQLRSHLHLCEGCKEYSSQSILISKALAQLGKFEEQGFKVSEDEILDLQTRILSQIGS